MSKNTRKKPIFILFILILSNYAYSQSNFNSNLKKEDSLELQKYNIENAIYVIRNFNGDKNLDIDKNHLIFLNNPKKPLKKHFRIFSVETETFLPLKDKNLYYCIEDKDFHKRIGIINMNGEIGLKPPKVNKIDDNFLWKIVQIFIDAQIGNKKYKKLYSYLQNKASMNI